MRPIPDWQRELRRAVATTGELLELLRLDPALLPAGIGAGRDFPLRVPRGFVARMRPGDPRDPLLLQVLPRGEELLAVPGFGPDPLQETRQSALPGLIHKYQGRVLLIASGACAVHCRYCFRRHFPYGDHQPWGEGWGEAIRYLAGDPSLREVILSGGDPLTASDARLAALAGALAAVPHLERLRVHSRLPVVLPERVDEGLLSWLTGTRLRPVMVIHANHPRELDDAVRAALTRLRRAGVTVLNQAVLLAGVNDDVATLRQLSEALFATGVLPYYLHLLDPVAGAAHFTVSEKRARRLAARLAAELPGYLVPRLAREVPGASAKEVLAPAATRSRSSTMRRVKPQITRPSKR
ncbi:MAG TPA: EF-P beta-lysylation protein EpmB [Thermoanaerobaculia bacterium]|nr:EF-P beta-lysylation protein EpmB [Thermoanaerobaculia bacterium]